MKRLAILISNAGTGTNLQAIIDAVASKKIAAEITIVISDSNDAYGITRAKKHNLPTYILQKDDSLPDLFHTVYSVDYVLLAGWKKIIPNEFIDAFPNKILNIHPGLIPETIDGVAFNPDNSPGLWNKGKFTSKAIQNVLEHQATYAGSTIHFLTREFDFGPVIERCFEKVIPDDSAESLYTRLKVKENEMYVKALEKLCNG